LQNVVYIIKTNADKHTLGRGNFQFLTRLGS